MRAALSPRASVARPIFNVVSETDSSPAEVYLYGDVVEETPTDWWTGQPVEGMYISLEDVLGQLETIRNANEITIHLNSSGGDLFAGIAIHNLLRQFSGKKTVVVDGLAASAASVIMCAGDTVQVHSGSMVMIHNVLSFLCGYVSTPELRELISSHEAAELAIMRIYEDKCHKPQDELQQMIDATTWFVGKDAVDEGFADELIERDEDPEDPEEDPERDAPPFVDAQLSADGRYLMVAGIPHLVANIGEIPPWINGANPVPNVAPAACGNTPIGGAEAPTIEEVEMPIANAAELRSTYPDLVAAIEADAAAAERARIHEIQDIANQIQNTELVNRAMFDEPMTAQALAYAALQASNQMAGEFVADMTNEVEEVAPLPAIEETEETDAAQEQAAINETIAMYNKLNGRG